VRRVRSPGLGAIVLAVAAVVGACARPAPTPTPLPSATPTAAVAPTPTVDAEIFDVQDEFISNVNDLTSEVESLASAPCPDLVAETRANPSEMPQIHGFAATLQRVGAQQTALSTDEVRSSLAALDLAINHLDGALSRCRINP
jgi:hypothetical protein